MDPSHRDGSGQAGHQMTSPDTGQMAEAVRTGREGLRLRIFVHEALRHGHKPLYAAIVALARREGLAGATVFRGMEGYGLHRHLHTTRLVDLSDDLPMDCGDRRHSGWRWCRTP